MTRAAAVMGLCCAAALAVGAGCGGSGGGAPDGGPVSRAARAIDDPACAPVAYGGPRRPSRLIVVSAPLQGWNVEHGIQASQAVKLEMARRGWRAGPYTVGIQMCDEAPPEGSTSDAARCRHNARAIGRATDVIAVVGPHASSCTWQALAILGRAPGGPPAVVSPANTYLGLTRAGPGTLPDEPGRHYPHGVRDYARVVPADDIQAAAAVEFARGRGARRVVLLNDGSAYGRGLSSAFAATAGRLGLAIAGAHVWDAGARDYRRLARVVAADAPDAVYLGGVAAGNSPLVVATLRRALGRRPQILAGDGFNQPEAIIEAGGAAAEGFLVSFPSVPVSRLPRAGRVFAADFERRYGAAPCCYAVQYAQATDVALAAIGGSDGTRGQVVDRLRRVRVRGGLLGDFTFDEHGDPTLRQIGIYQIRDGREVFVTAVSPRPRDLARR